MLSQFTWRSENFYKIPCPLLTSLALCQRYMVYLSGLVLVCLGLEDEQQN